jgi:hypothetical protein
LDVSHESADLVTEIRELDFLINHEKREREKAGT